MHWEEGAEYSEEFISKQIRSNHDALHLYIFLQYHLHLQLTEVHRYAKQNKVLLKGDIPIGVSPCSVDVWSHPELFNLNGQAGAPPDAFSEKGQNWGFPTYNWEQMSKDGYDWWKLRLIHMSQYFDAYRLDHILGFFRIWEIPSHAKWGLLGQFNRAMPLLEDEIETYGLKFDEYIFLKPYITDKILLNYFALEAANVKKQFIMLDEFGRYIMNPIFDTQRKVAAYFSAKKDLMPTDIMVRDGLYKLISQVLFVKDLRNPDYYHPRISYQHNEAFLGLSDSEKDAYLRLYEEFFYHRHDEFWKHHAMKRLPAMLNSTSMLAFGEDLGMIPSCVPEAMRELNLISLEIQRMPKQFGQEFGVTYFAPYLSLCTTSTHDMSTLRAWWEEDREQTQRYFNTVLFENGEAPQSCEPWIVEKIITQHIQSPAIWVVLPFQDWLGMDENLRHPKPHQERINVPDNPKNVWSYRMHISLEKLLSSTELNDKIRNIIRSERS
jgi:4-alpha-glucanotransferase